MFEKLDSFDILAMVEDLALLVEEHDRADKESDIALFAENDPLENLKQGLAEKLSSSSGRTLSECQNEAEEIVRQIKQELTKPTIKSQICSTLKLLSGDFSNLSVGVVSAVLATLITGGALSLPVLPALPGIAIAVGGFVLTRSGIEFVCSDSRKDA